MMSTGSGGRDVVEREPTLFNSAKDFSMMSLGLGIRENIQDYGQQAILFSFIIVSKGFKKQKEIISILHFFFFIIFSSSITGIFTVITSYLIISSINTLVDYS